MDQTMGFIIMMIILIYAYCYYDNPYDNTDDDD